MSQESYQYKNLRRAAELVKNTTNVVLILGAVGLVVALSEVKDIDGDDVTDMLKKNAGITQRAPDYATPISQDAMAPVPQPSDSSAYKEPETYNAGAAIIEALPFGKKNRGGSPEQPIEITFQSPTKTSEVPSPEPAIIVSQPTPIPEVPTCHGLPLGETSVFLTDDKNIGIGVVSQSSDVGLSVVFNNGQVYPCSRVTPRN